MRKLNATRCDLPQNTQLISSYDNLWIQDSRFSIQTYGLMFIYSMLSLLSKAFKQTQEVDNEAPETYINEKLSKSDRA